MSMWFRNLLLYRLAPGWDMAPGTLEQRLATRPLLPCTGLNTRSRGWVAPRGNGQLVYAQNRQLLIACGTEDKILPAAVIKQAAQERAAEIERQKGFKPGRKQMRDIKDQVVSELLPRAFSRQRSVRAWLDPADGWLVVDTASPLRAESLLELLRDTLDEAPWLGLEAQRAPAEVMTRWLAAGRAPHPFALGDECELSGGETEKSIIKYLRYPLQGEEVRRHLGQGKRVTRLKLHWHDRMSFVLDDKLQIRRLSFLGLQETREQPQVQDPDEQFDAEFALLTGELSLLLQDLTTQLGLQARTG